MKMVALRSTDHVGSDNVFLHSAFILPNSTFLCFLLSRSGIKAFYLVMSLSPTEHSLTLMMKQPTFRLLLRWRVADLTVRHDWDLVRPWREFHSAWPRHFMSVHAPSSDIVCPAVCCHASLVDLLRRWLNQCAVESRGNSDVVGLSLSCPQTALLQGRVFFGIPFFCRWYPWNHSSRIFCETPTEVVELIGGC